MLLNKLYEQMYGKVKVINNINAYVWKGGGYKPIF